MKQYSLIRYVKNKTVAEGFNPTTLEYYNFSGQEKIFKNQTDLLFHDLLWNSYFLWWHAVGETEQKGFGVDLEPLIKDFLRVFTNISKNLGNLYDFPFNSKTVFLKMLIEVFLD